MNSDTLPAAAGERDSGPRSGASLPRPHFSLFGAWALAFGCALGWDAVVLPWTSFLPVAGPLGTALGLLAGAALMAVVAWNYHFMVNRHPGPGGVYAYATAAFGPDHGFLCAWFAGLTYVAIIWLDAMVIAYFLQDSWNLDFHVGVHHVVAGHEICLVHVLVSVAAIALAAAICCRRRLAGSAQSLCAAVFAVVAVAGFGAALARHGGGWAAAAPAFAPGGEPVLAQIAGVVAFAPWLFVGFESISNASGEFRFPVRRSFGVMAAAIAAAALAYALLSLVPALVPGIATGASTWPDAVADYAAVDSAVAEKTAYATLARCFGRGGVAAISALFFAAVFSNLVGNTLAASRLFAAMAADGALPGWLGRLNRDGSPRNAVLAIAACSPVAFVLGRSLMSIAVGIALVGAAIAYAYTSAAAWRTARAEGRPGTQATGLLGTAFSMAIAAVFLLPTVASETASISAESYFVLVLWCLVGLMAFLYGFHRDDRRRFGSSPVAWLVLFGTILFLLSTWIHQATERATERAFDDILRGHAEFCPAPGPADPVWRDSIRARQNGLTRTVQRNEMVQTAMTVLSLALMLCLYAILRRREREREREKARAQSFFFSTVSHDIRTPLNAIIGFSEMLKDGIRGEAERKQAVESIAVSGQTLLALVNDVLDLSKLESGKMEILPEPTDVPRLLRDLLDAFRVAGNKPGLELRLAAGGMPRLMLDPQRLRQIVFNLVGNAVKFTERGHVELRASFVPAAGGETGTFRLEVEDTGCGISEENLKRIASAWVQVGPKGSRSGGTGLGLAICKQLAAAMGGKLGVSSALGKGSTFSVEVPGVAVAPAGAAAEPEAAAPAPAAPAPDIRRILVVDDSNVNRMVLRALLKKTGDFDVELAADGREALAALRAAPADRPFDLVLTDLWMPNLGGEGLVKEIRADAALASLRVVVATADVELRGKAAAMGFDDILVKPVTSATLAAVLSGCGRRGERSAK